MTKLATDDVIESSHEAGTSKGSNVQTSPTVLDQSLTLLLNIFILHVGVSTSINSPKWISAAPAFICSTITLYTLGLLGVIRSSHNPCSASTRLNGTSSWSVIVEPSCGCDILTLAAGECEPISQVTDPPSIMVERYFVEGPRLSSQGRRG